MAEPGRQLPDDAAVRELLSRLDAALERVEQAPGPAARAAIDAVHLLTEVYGEALSRILRCAPPPLAERLACDELVGHLLVLHDLHPEPLPVRVERALAEVRPYLESRGAGVELVGIDGTVAQVRLSGGCRSCSSSTDGLREVVTEAVLAMAPELDGVEPVPELAGPAVIPVDTLFQRTGTTR